MVYWSDPNVDPAPQFALERQRLAALVGLAWGIPVALAVVYWTRYVDYGEQGRLALIASPGYALIFVLGWQAWAPQRAQRWVEGAIVLFMVVLAAGLIPFLYNGYLVPRAGRSAGAGSAAERPLRRRHAVDRDRFARRRRRVPWRSTAGHAYWTTAQPITGFYTLFIHLADADNNLLYQFDGVPVAGNHPTAQWRPGEVFADSYLIRPPRANRRAGQLEPGFLPARGDRPAGHGLRWRRECFGDRLVAAQVRLHSTPAVPSTSQPPLAAWENGISLAAASVITDSSAQPAGIQLTWRARTGVHGLYGVCTGAGSRR